MRILTFCIFTEKFQKLKGCDRLVRYFGGLALQQISLVAKSFWLFSINLLALNQPPKVPPSHTLGVKYLKKIFLKSWELIGNFMNCLLNFLIDINYRTTIQILPQDVTRQASSFKTVTRFFDFYPKIPLTTVNAQKLQRKNPKTIYSRPFSATEYNVG